MDNLKNIKKLLLNHRILYFENSKLIHHDISKTNARNKIIKKYLKSKKIRKFTRIEISFHHGKKFYQGGPIQIQIKQYQIKDKKLSLVYSKGNSGSIWISKTFIQKNKFTNLNEILIIIKKLIKNVNVKKNLKIMSINLLKRFL